MIKTAVQKDENVHIYDKEGNHLRSFYGDLYEFTNSTVSIKRGNYVHLYDEKGRLINSIHTVK